MKLKEEATKNPVLFAGTKFYEVLMQNMRLADEASLNKDYDTWLLLLQKFFNKVRPFINQTKAHIITNQLNMLRERLNLLVSKQRLQISGIERAMYVLEIKILALESDLYVEARELLLKTGGVLEESWDSETMRRDWA